jgi:hypothetical protein
MSLSRPLPKPPVHAKPYFMWNSATTGYPSIQAPWWAANESQKVRG